MTIFDPPQNQATSAPTCECHNTAICVRRFSDGREHYVRQCLCCGRQLATVPKATVRVPHLLEPFDEALREAWDAKLRQYYDERRQQREQEQVARSGAWWDKYDRYLLTPEWRAKRDKVLERDKHLCQGCRDRRAITAHHLTYDHVGHEFLFELIAVCVACHERLHERHGDTH